MSDKLKEEEIGEIKLVLTSCTASKISERFWVQDPAQVTRVLQQAMKNGLVSVNDGRAFVEHGCILIVGKLHDSVFVVETVLNLSQGISERLKEQLIPQRPSPWSNVLIVLEGNGGWQ